MNTLLSSVLPNNLSGLIRTAIHDLILCEEDPRYVIDMSLWHVPRDNVCYVCLAGVVIAQTLYGDTTRYFYPVNFDSECCKLSALDSLRRGRVLEACQELEIKNCLVRDRYITSYETDPDKFKAEMLQLANDLEEVGL